MPPARRTAVTLLILDDNAGSLELLSSALAQPDLEILTASDPEEGLDLVFDRHPHVVLTDLVMPDRMNGRELAERLWADRPKLKVIFTSGYSADVVGKDFVLRRGLNYLQKPYHPQKLALAIRDCLDALN